MSVDIAFALRRALHADPEVGLHLPRTAARVSSALPADLEIYLSAQTSSFLAVVRGGQVPSAAPRRAVLLRADMDALPVEEATGLPYASTNGAMHACGHDLHTAALVGAAHALQARREHLAGDVVLLFQAGEEALDGARLLVEEGLLDRPGVGYAAGLAVHVIADRELGAIESRSGAVTGAGTSIRAVFRGRGGHGATPHRAQDPIPALIAALHEIPVALSRGLDAHDAIVFTPGSVHAGNRRNIIPDTAEFDATMRSFDPEVRARAEQIVRRVCEGCALAHGVSVNLEVTQGYPSIDVDATEHAFARPLVSSVPGLRFAEASRPAAMTEDFSRIAALMPSWFGFVGACPPDASSSEPSANHSATALFDDAVLAPLIDLETRWALERLAADHRQESS